MIILPLDGYPTNKKSHSQCEQLFSDPDEIRTRDLLRDSQNKGYSIAYQLVTFSNYKLLSNNDLSVTLNNDN